MVDCTVPYSEIEPYEELMLGQTEQFRRHKYNVLRWIPPDFWPAIQCLTAETTIGPDKKRQARAGIQAAIQDLADLLDDAIAAVPTTSGPPYHHGISFVEAGGYAPTAPVLFLPVGLYPAGNIVWDARVPMEGEGLYSTRLQCFRGAELHVKLDGAKTYADVLAETTGWEPENESVLHLRPGQGPDARVLGGLFALRLVPMGRYSRESMGYAPFAEHCLRATNRVHGALLLEGVYFAECEDDNVRFDAGVDDLYVDRAYAQCGGRHWLAFHRKPGTTSRFAATVTRFTYGQQRPRSRTYTSPESFQVQKAPALHPPLPPEPAPGSGEGEPAHAAYLAAQVHPFVDKYLDWLAKSRLGVEPFPCTNFDTVQRFLWAKDEEAKVVPKAGDSDPTGLSVAEKASIMRFLEHWGAGMVYVRDGARGSLYIAGGRLEIHTLPVPPQNPEYGPYSVQEGLPTKLGLPAQVVVENPDGAETSIELEHFVGFTERQAGMAVARATNRGLRLTTRRVLITATAAQLFCDRPEGPPKGAVGPTGIISEIDGPKYESGYTDPGSGWQRPGGLSSQGRRLERRAAPPSGGQTRYRVGDVIMNTGATKDTMGWVVTGPEGGSPEDAGPEGFWITGKHGVPLVDPQAVPGGSSWKLGDPEIASECLPGDNIVLYVAAKKQVVATGRVLRVAPREGRVTLSVGIPAGTSKTLLLSRLPKLVHFGTP